MDLCTAWKVLSVKLSLDRRPQVLCSLCQLFSIVPSLATNSSDYQVGIFYSSFVLMESNGLQKKEKKKERAGLLSKSEVFSSLGKLKLKPCCN